MANSQQLAGERKVWQWLSVVAGIILAAFIGYGNNPNIAALSIIGLALIAGIPLGLIISRIAVLPIVDSINKRQAVAYFTNRGKRVRFANQEYQRMYETGQINVIPSTTPQNKSSYPVGSSVAASQKISRQTQVKPASPSNNYAHEHTGPLEPDSEVERIWIKWANLQLPTYLIDKCQEAAKPIMDLVDTMTLANLANNTLDQQQLFDRGKLTSSALALMTRASALIGIEYGPVNQTTQSLESKTPENAIKSLQFVSQATYKILESMLEDCITKQIINQATAARIQEAIPTSIVETGIKCYQIGFDFAPWAKRGDYQTGTMPSNTSGDKSETKKEVIAVEEWECEVCNAIVAADAKVCPSCGTEFED